VCPSRSYYQQRGIYSHPQQLFAPQYPLDDSSAAYSRSSSGVAIKAPERVRTAPGSTASSPRLGSEGSVSPSAEQELLSYQPQQSQQGAVALQASLSPAPSGGFGGGGALSAAAIAAAAAAEAAFPSTGGVGGAVAASQQQLAAFGGLAASVMEQEMCRSIVAAEEAARGGAGVALYPPGALGSHGGVRSAGGWEEEEEAEVMRAR
jgi:hypothetical protein